MDQIVTVGIDPGKYGAAASCIYERMEGEWVPTNWATCPIPYRTLHAGTNREVVDWQALARKVWPSWPFPDAIVMEEPPIVIRKGGVTMTASKGMRTSVVGAERICIAIEDAWGDHYFQALPAVWKRHVGLDAKDDWASMKMAKANFPEFDYDGEMKINSAAFHRKDGEADALLLSMYALVFVIDRKGM